MCWLHPRFVLPVPCCRQQMYAVVHGSRCDNNVTFSVANALAWCRVRVRTRLSTSGTCPLPPKCPSRDPPLWDSPPKPRAPWINLPPPSLTLKTVSMVPYCSMKPNQDSSHLVFVGCFWNFWHLVVMEPPYSTVKDCTAAVQYMLFPMSFLPSMP